MARNTGWATALAALTGGLQGYTAGREQQRTRARQKELDALERAQVESALETARLNRTQLQRQMGEEARQRQLRLRTPEQLLGTTALPSDFTGPPTEAQTTLAELGPLAGLSLEQVEPAMGLMEYGRGRRREAEAERLRQEELARARGPLSPELQETTGFRGTVQDLESAAPFLLEQLQQRGAAERAQAAGAGQGEDALAKMQDQIRVQQEFRDALEANTAQLLADEAVQNPQVAEALESEKLGAALSGRPLNWQVVFGKLPPDRAAAIRSQAGAQAAMSTLALLPNTQQIEPSIVQSILNQVPAGTARARAIPGFERTITDIYGQDLAPMLGLSYGAPSDTLLFGRGESVAPPPATVSITRAPVPEGQSYESMPTQEEYIQFRVGEGATPAQAAEEWGAAMEYQGNRARGRRKKGKK